MTRFEEDEPFCFFLPVRKDVLPNTEIHIHRLSDHAELEARHNQFRDARTAFMERIKAGDPDAIKEAWQRHYFVGRHPDGVLAPEHLNKLRLSEPIDVREPPPATRPCRTDNRAAARR